MQRNLLSVLACSRSEQKKRPIRYPGNTTEKWPPTIDRCQSNTRTWSIRMRVGGPSGSLFKRQVGLGSRPFAYHPPPGRARAKGEVEIAQARDLSRYPRPISAAFADRRPEDHQARAASTNSFR